MGLLSRRSFCTVTAAALCTPFGAVHASEARVAVDGRGVALDGYDTTAYWQLGQPQLGLPAHTQDWRAVQWHFATAQNAAAFAADPARFAPQFGGFCTRAMAAGKIVNGDPEVWRIYKDRLYLFARPVGGEKFDEDPEPVIVKAMAQWESLT